MTNATCFRKCGYESIPRYFYSQPVEPKQHLDFVKRVEWKALDIATKSTIKHLYTVTSKLFNGTMIRADDTYWDLWVANETPIAYLFIDNQQRILG
jgi:hypothetical protein